MMNNDLVERLNKLNNELLTLFCSGTAETYANKDLISYKPGTVIKMQDLCSRRNEIIDILKCQK